MVPSESKSQFLHHSQLSISPSLCPFGAKFDERTVPVSLPFITVIMETR